MKAAVSYVRSSFAELQKVVWPTKHQIISYTIIILISTAIAMLIVAMLDYGLSILLNRFLIK